MGFGKVESGVEVIPRAFLVCHVDGPFDRSVGGGEFSDHLPVLVISVNAEQGALALELSRRVAISAGRRRRGMRDFGTDEILVAVADTGDAYRRVNAGLHNRFQIHEFILLTFRT